MQKNEINQIMRYKCRSTRYKQLWYRNAELWDIKAELSDKCRVTRYKCRIMKFKQLHALISEVWETHNCEIGIHNSEKKSELWDTKQNWNLQMFNSDKKSQNCLI